MHAQLQSRNTPAHMQWHRQALSNINEQRSGLLSQANSLREPIDYVLDSEGKRLRPLLLLCFAYLGEKNLAPSPQEYRAAAAVELLHEASLVHDDILDSSPIRRDKLSTGEQFNVRTATHAGGYITSICLATLAECDEDICFTLGASLKELVRAQLMEELPTPSNILAHKQRSIGIMQGKTGTLFELAINVGAHLNRTRSGRQLASAATTDFCRHFSLAFQIRDDLADLEHDAAIRKPGGNDLVQGNPTWPFLIWAEKSGAHQHAWQRLLDCKGNEELASLLQADIIATDTARDVRARIHHELDQAVALLPLELDSPARDCILDIIGKIRP